MSTPSRGRWQLFLIVGIALGSLLGAYLLFYLAGPDMVPGTTNRGSFVRPPTNLAELSVRDAEGRPPEPGVWWLWVVPGGDCAAPCREALAQLERVHALLHRDAGRVRRALVNGGPGGAAVAEEFPRLVRLSGNLAGLPPGIYVVDPLGNLVLHYPLADAGEPVLDDLKQLLKGSQIG